MPPAFFVSTKGANMSITAETLTVAVSGLLALLFLYFPGLNTWFAARPDHEKRQIMLGVVAAFAASAFGLSCAGLLTELTGWVVTCDRAGGIELLKVVFIAAAANQGTYNLIKGFEPASVKTVKALRDGKAGLSLGKG
jgi:hypothetical protein